MYQVKIVQNILNKRSGTTVKSQKAFENLISMTWKCPTIPNPSLRTMEICNATRSFVSFF